MALKLLHTADWHIGLKFPAFDENDAVKLSRARLEAVENALGLAERSQVDAVLCAGDLFDEPSPSPDFYNGLLTALRRQPSHRPILLLPGNHDPLGPGSIYEEHHAFRRGLPEWVHVVDRPNFEFAIGDRAVVYATPCQGKAGQREPVAEFPAREPDDTRIRIGLAHGQTKSMDGGQPNFPIDTEAAGAKGLDYLALGDWHNHTESRNTAGTTIVYPGPTEPGRFGEAERGHAVLALFPGPGKRPVVRTEPVGRWRWIRRECRSLEELRELRHENDLEASVLRLNLTMELPLEEYAETETIVRELKGSEAAHGLAGILQVEREGLRLSVDHAPPELDPSLAPVAERLIQDSSEVARRALYHLYQMAKSKR